MVKNCIFHIISVVSHNINGNESNFFPYFPHKIFTRDKGKLFNHGINLNWYWGKSFMILIRLATKMSPYNSFMPQRFCNTLAYVNSKQIKEYVFKKLRIYKTH